MNTTSFKRNVTPPPKRSLTTPNAPRLSVTEKTAGSISDNHRRSLTDARQAMTLISKAKNIGKRFREDTAGKSMLPGLADTVSNFILNQTDKRDLAKIKDDLVAHNVKLKDSYSDYDLKHSEYIETGNLEAIAKLDITEDEINETENLLNTIGYAVLIIDRLIERMNTPE